METSRFQEALRRYCTTLKRCKHESDYSVLYDYISMEQLLCHPCWNEERQVRIDDDTVRIFRPKQLHAVRVSCLRCGTDVTVQKCCTRCFSGTPDC